MRIMKSLIVVGIVLMIASFGSWTTRGVGSSVSFNNYEGVLARSAGNILLEVTSDEGDFFSLFVFTFDSFLGILEEGSIDNATPLFERRNITDFSGIVSIPTPGWYAILVTPVENTTIGYEIDYYQTLPLSGIFISGAVASILGLVLLLSGHRLRIKENIQKL